MKLICPYCNRTLTEDKNFCCSEAGHGVAADELEAEIEAENERMGA